MPKRKTKLTGIEYLEQSLNWKAFCKHHPTYPLAVREVLDELYFLRNKIKKLNQLSKGDN